MIITNYGAEFFKIQFGDAVLAFNPISKDSKLKGARFGSDVAFVTTNHPDFNGIDSVSHGDKAPFAVIGPGEYEIQGIFIKGIAGESQYGREKRINTSYIVTLEGMNICFLGALSKDLTNEAKESLGEIDILFVPIGGDGVLTFGEAYKLAVSIEPKIIVPIHYGNIGDKDALKNFLKEGGSESVKPIEKLTLKKKDLEGKEGDIVVLENSNV